MKRLRMTDWWLRLKKQKPNHNLNQHPGMKFHLHINKQTCITSLKFFSDNFIPFSTSSLIVFVILIEAIRLTVLFLAAGTPNYFILPIV